MRRLAMTPPWWAVLVAVALAASGCSSPARRVLTSVNAYHFNLDAYERACGGAGGPVYGVKVVGTPDQCAAWYGDLTEHKRRLQDAEAAIKRGGALPLQLRAMKRAEKAAGRS